MLLKIVCQICGRTEVLDTEKPYGSSLHWESYKLEEFGIPEEHPFHDYEIWICPECLEEAVEYWDVECYGDDPKYYPTLYIPEINYEALRMMVLKSLGKLEEWFEKEE